MDPDPAGFRVVGSGPDPAGSENCGSCAPLLITARKVLIAFLVSGGPVGIRDSEELTEKGQFYHFLLNLTFTINTAFVRL